MLLAPTLCYICYLMNIIRDNQRFPDFFGRRKAGAFRIVVQAPKIGFQYVPQNQDQHQPGDQREHPLP
jgi:hypothetical protein